MLVKLRSRLWRYARQELRDSWPMAVSLGFMLVWSALTPAAWGWFGFAGGYGAAYQHFNGLARLALAAAADEMPGD